MSDPTMNQNQDEEISLKDIFLIIKEYFLAVKKHWKLSVFFVLPIVLYLGYQAAMVPITYPGKLTFMMESDDGGGGGVKGLLGSLVGGKSKSGLKKVLVLFHSQKIVYDTFFEKDSINGKVDFLANHMIEAYTFDGLIDEYYSLGSPKEGWIKQIADLEDFSFSHGDIDRFTNEERLVLKVIYNKIVGYGEVGIDQSLSSALDEESGIMTITLSSVSESFTIAFLKVIYGKLSKFYIDKTVEKQLKTYKIMQFKNDSIKRELLNAEYSLADFNDRNHNMVTIKGSLRKEALQRKVGLLSSMYAGSVRNLEDTDFALRNRIPIVQVVDLPRAPIYRKKASIVLALIKGILMGLALYVVFIVVRKMIRSIMGTESPQHALVN